MNGNANSIDQNAVILYDLGSTPGQGENHGCNEVNMVPQA